MAEISSMSIVPARNEAQLFRQSVQAPSLTPRWLPGIIGPVTRWKMGLFAEMPPISCAGTVLSQPPISTTASHGCALTISSVSMLMRFRKYMLVGAEKLSCRLIVGKSTARPPPSWTPRLTASRSCGMLAWHGLKLEYVLTMPTMGRDRASSLYPRALMKTLRRKREKWASP